MNVARLIGSIIALSILTACQPSADAPPVEQASPASSPELPSSTIETVAPPVPVAEVATSPATSVPTEIADPQVGAAELSNLTSIEAQATTAQAVISGGRASAREVREQLDDYLSRSGLHEGPQLKSGSRVNVMIEIAGTTRQPGERGFQNSRRTAYLRAYHTAIGKFISQRAQDIENQMGSVFRDNSDNMRLLQEACAPSREQVIAEKLNVLAEAVVDEALAKLDAAAPSPAEPPKFNCPAQEELFRTSTSRRAAESLSGLRLVFSSEVNNQVGIILVHSTKFEQTARRLLSGEGTRVPTSDPLGELRTKLKQDLDQGTLKGTFGTRIMTAANGEPIVVTFGQSGPDVGPADSERTIGRKFDSARRLAYNEAAAELARFARTTAVFTSESTSIDESGKYVDLVSGAYEEPALVAEKLLETVETQSRLSVQGVAQVHSWEIEDEQGGQPLVGVVLAWSPSLQSTFGRDAPPIADSQHGARASGKTDASGQHRAQGAEMKEDW